MLVLPIHRTRLKEEAHIQIGSAFAHHRLHPFTKPPPVGGIVVRIWECQDADLYVAAEGFLKKEAAAPRMNAFSHDDKA